MKLTEYDVTSLVKLLERVKAHLEDSVGCATGDTPEENKLLAQVTSTIRVLKAE